MKRPYITIKFAQTLDGKIAARDGSSRWISTPEARRFAHSLRARNDAVLVGIGTVLADDSSLTTRLVKGKNPARIIIDKKLRIPLDSKIIKTAYSVKTIVIASPKAGRAKIAALRKKGIEIILFPPKRGRISLKKVMPLLYKKGIKSVLVEGGKSVITSFLKAGLADKVIAVISPGILGRGLESVGDLGINTIKGALKFRLKSVTRLGTNVIITSATS